MSRVGVVSALPLEARCLRGSLGRPAARPAEAMVGICGPGPTRAQRTAERMVAQGAAGLLSWGLAGGIEPGITSGTLIAADQVMLASSTAYRTDRAWRQRVLSALPPRVAVVEAPLFASEGIVATAADKASLLHRYAAVAVDMESGGIARAASRYGLPLLVLRVVVDPVDMALPPAFADAVDSGGALRPFGLINGLMRQPAMLWPLLQLAYGARAAGSTLRRIAPVVMDSRTWP
ncbi:MAG: purine phosphorylase [Nitrococcus sp.]|nr:purine phosphorylase [Nitrococcus sp.]